MVVLVDSQRFLLHWRADRAGLHAHEANGDPTTWIHDYKFGLAAKGFALGVENPVPLATVGCRFNTNEHFLADLLSRIDPRRQPASPVVTFTNGITRTLWLLTNGASSFPVECSRDDSQLLANCCGLPGAPPKAPLRSPTAGTNRTDDELESLWPWRGSDMSQSHSYSTLSGTEGWPDKVNLRRFHCC
ncbi:plasmid fertility inhibition factor family protein [Variovorax sp. S12S4]|uniref:plasmid fertility inhibition factor family protein n=1 Tax=Variovorax sp. S12S4 TaxID=3029170 RepID=UPI00406CC08F